LKLNLNQRYRRPRPLSEQHPREQGLKLTIPGRGGAIAELSEQHPREQGLKPKNELWREWDKMAFRATSKRTRIETSYASTPTNSRYHSFRATSKRTRIETRDLPSTPGTDHGFQSNIQENKD